MGETIVEHTLIGSNSIQALKKMSQSFDNSFYQQYLEKVSDSDNEVDAHLAQEILIEFIKNNQTKLILNAFYSLNPIFVEIKEYLFSEEYLNILDLEWIIATSNINYLDIRSRILIIYNHKINHKDRKFKIAVNKSGIESSDYQDKALYLCNHIDNNCECFYVSEFEHLRNISFLPDYRAKQATFRLYLDWNSVFPEFKDYLIDPTSYVYYSGAYHLVHLENTDAQLLDNLSNDFLLAKYVARHSNTSEKTLNRLLSLENIEVNTGIYYNPRATKSLKLKALNQGIINESKYALETRTKDLMFEYFAYQDIGMNYRDFMKSTRIYSDVVHRKI